MPSEQLNKIVNAIESQNTDHFGKYYLYTAVLHRVTMRDGKSTAELVPSYIYKAGGFFGLSSKSKGLNVGELPISFISDLSKYSHQY